MRIISKISKEPTHIHDSVDVRVVEKNNGDECDARALMLKEWKNTAEIVDFVDNHCPDAAWGRGSSHKKGYGSSVDGAVNKGWRYGTYRTLERTRKALQQGKCSKLVSTYIDEYRQKLESDGLYNTPDELKDSVKRRRVWREEGGELDIDAVMSGDPNYWVKTVRNGKMRIVRLVINYSFSCGNKPEESARLLGVTYCVAEILERLGYGVEIYGAQACHSPRSKDWGDGDHEQGSIVPIKQVQEPLDLRRVGSVSVTGLFRYFGFVMDNELFGNFNGYCTALSKEMTAFMGADVLICTSWLRGNQTMKVQKIIDRLKGV